MSVSQTLQSAQNGTVWSRREGGTTYFLRKVNNRYEVWTSLDSGAKSTVTLDQAVTYYSQHNLVNTNTAAPRTVAAPTRPVPPPPPPPAPAAPRRPAAVSTPAPTPAPTPTSSTPAPTNVTNTTNTSAVSTDPSINKLLSTTSLVDAQGQPTTSSDPSINKLLTDGNKPLVDETGTVRPTDPSIVALVDTPPLVQIDEVKLQEELADITADIPNFGDYEAIYSAESQATEQDQVNFQAKDDWRVRLSLAPNSKYLYNAADPGILKPLSPAFGGTDGVIFPYTPNITVNYVANYEPVNIVHSNYKIFQYSNSAVEQVTIGCDFTAQDTFEANYLLAVIHFFRSMTKMFYGQDTLPKNGTPPPLCYMYGMGGYQFAAHPLAINGFSYTLPTDVDYIKTTSVQAAGTPNPSTAPNDVSATRLSGTGATKGGKVAAPTFSGPAGNETVTWVPTRIQLTVSCLPIMSRNAVSNRFSLEKYADGTLLLGTKQPNGGMW